MEMGWDGLVFFHYFCLDSETQCDSFSNHSARLRTSILYLQLLKSPRFFNLNVIFQALVVEIVASIENVNTADDLPQFPAVVQQRHIPTIP